MTQSQKSSTKCALINFVDPQRHAPFPTLFPRGSTIFVPAYAAKRDNKKYKIIIRRK